MVQLNKRNILKVCVGRNEGNKKAVTQANDLIAAGQNQQRTQRRVPPAKSGGNSPRPKKQAKNNQNNNANLTDPFVTECPETTYSNPKCISHYHRKAKTAATGAVRRMLEKQPLCKLSQVYKCESGNKCVLTQHYHLQVSRKSNNKKQVNVDHERDPKTSKDDELIVSDFTRKGISTPLVTLQTSTIDTTNDNNDINESNAPLNREDDVVVAPHERGPQVVNMLAEIGRQFNNRLIEFEQLVEEHKEDVHSDDDSISSMGTNNANQPGGGPGDSSSSSDSSSDSDNDSEHDIASEVSSVTTASSNTPNAANIDVDEVANYEERMVMFELADAEIDQEIAIYHCHISERAETRYLHCLFVPNATGGYALFLNNTEYNSVRRTTLFQTHGPELVQQRGFIKSILDKVCDMLFHSTHHPIAYGRDDNVRLTTHTQYEMWTFLRWAMPNFSRTHTGDTNGLNAFKRTYVANVDTLLYGYLMARFSMMAVNASRQMTQHTAATLFQAVILAQDNGYPCLTPQNYELTMNTIVHATNMLVKHHMLMANMAGAGLPSKI